MSIFAEIESLEQRVQQLLAQAGEYSSVDDFVATYTNALVEALSSLSQAELAGLDLQQLVEDALEASADFINVNLAAEIQSGVNNVLAETATFYTARGLDIPDLADAISRTEAVQDLTELFQTNMAGMREELLNGTIDTLQSELAQGFLDRDDLTDLIFQYTDGKAHYARTNARMIVSSYNRIGREEVRASAGLTHGFYYGDARVNTRPFCLRCIDKVFTIEQIEQMDNGQLSPVKIYAGGWNCIHSWLWVDPEWDEELKGKINSEPVVAEEADYLKLKLPKGDD